MFYSPPSTTTATTNPGLGPSPLHIGFKRSPTSVSRRSSTSIRKRARTSTGSPATASASELTKNEEERLARLHAAAFCALRDAVASNDDGLVRRMRVWERQNERLYDDSRRRRRHRARARPIAPPHSDDDDGVLVHGADTARSPPWLVYSSSPRKAPVAFGPPDLELDVEVEEEDDDEDDVVIIHTAPGAGLASRPAPTPSPSPQTALPPPPPSAGRKFVIPPPLFVPAPVAAAAPASFAAPHLRCPRQRGDTSDSDDSDADADVDGMVWESTSGSSPYLSAATSATSDDESLALEPCLLSTVAAEEDPSEAAGGATDKALRALRLALAAGWGAIDDYEPDAILALQRSVADHA